MTNLFEAIFEEVGLGTKTRSHLKLMAQHRVVEQIDYRGRERGRGNVNQSDDEQICLKRMDVDNYSHQPENHFTSTA